MPDWNDFFDDYFWVIVCFILGTDGDPVPPDDEGLAAYTAVNLSRADQGLAYTDTPPPDDFFPTDEMVTVTTASIHASMNAGMEPPSTGYFWSIYGRAATSTPASLTQQRKKLKYIGTMNIEAGVDYDITALVQTSGVSFPGCCLILEFRIGARGSVARMVSQTSLYI